MVDDGSDDATTSVGATAGHSGEGAAIDGRVVVPVSGELDAQNSDQLRQRLFDAFDRSPTSVAVDLGRLDFIDSVGLSVLVGAHNRGVADGIPFVVLEPSPSCRRVLEITGLVAILDVR